MTCDFQQRADGWACSKCGRVARSQRRPVAECSDRQPAVCPYLGQRLRTAPSINCPSLRRDVPIHLCQLHGVETAGAMCSEGRKRWAGRTCLECRDAGENVPQTLPLEAITGKRHNFNAGLTRWGDGWLIAWRTNRAHLVGEKAEVWLARADEQFLSIDAPERFEVDGSHEDPRLLTFRGRVILQTYDSALGCLRLFEVANQREIVIDHFRAGQKNWAFFEGPGAEPCCVWYPSHGKQHKVIEFRWAGPWRLEPVREHFTPATMFPPEFGEARGGAPPVLRAGRFWHWFHGRQQAGGVLDYTLGVYTFEAVPPFRPLKCSPVMLRSPRVIDGKRVVFVCGAAVSGGEWVITAGLDDLTTIVLRWPVEYVEGVLR